MAVQQLTQPILNPIAAFDATKEQTISFVVIGGAQVVANRLVIQDNQTGVEIYSNIESTLKLEHTIPANTLKNGGYYNAVVYTLDNSNTLSSPSTPVPFYCYTQPLLTITNIPATETIENGTYTFEGSYSQIEGELLNSYQFTLYDSNKEVLSQTPLIYYETDSSLSYTFVGMNNDTSYYIELSGQTLNNTSMSTGLLYFTVRYIQPASFAICDLVNDCKDGYVQISSNIVAIDGHSNPDPPIYIDDKEVDLRDPDSYVEWNSGFRIQDDFTMRAWGRDFNDYQNIITLTNDINTEETPNKIELKWMLGDVVKEQLSYEDIDGELINVSDSVTAPIKNLEIYGNSIQVDRNADVYVEGKSTQEVQAASFKTATGNPVTITDGELDKPVKLGQIDGLSTQATRSGKNKFDISKLNNNVSDKDSKTGSFSVENLYGATIMTSDNLSKLLKPNTSYKCIAEITLIEKPETISNNYANILTIYKSIAPANNIPILKLNSGDEKNNWQLNETKTIETEFTTDSDLSLYNMLFYGYTTDSEATGKFAFKNVIIIESTEENETFEEYGVSPSPEFPSPIHSLGDDVNLFDGEIEDYETGTFHAGYTLDGKNKLILTNQGNWGRVGCTISNLEKNTEYTISSEVINDEESYCGFYSPNVTSRDMHTDSKFKAIITISSDSEGKIYFEFYGNLTDTALYNVVVFDKIKLQKGTVATPYSEYGKGTVEVKQTGKNLCPDKFKEYTKSIYYRIYPINLEKGETYNFSATLIGTQLTGCLIALVKYGSKYVDFKDILYPVVNTAGVIVNRTINVDDTYTDPKIVVYVNTETDFNNLFKNYEIQLEKGEATDYEPYFSNSYVSQVSEPLRSLPNGVKDTIETDGIHRRVGEYVFSGTEPFGNSEVGYAYYLIPNAKKMGYIYSNYLPMGDSKIKESIWIGTGATAITYGDTITDLNSLKTFLKQKYEEGNPVYAEYELAEEVVEPFTEEQKEVFNSITTQSGINIFDAQTNMELKYNYNYEIPSPEVESPIKSEGESWNIFNKDALAKTSGASKTVLDTGVRVTQTVAGKYKYIGIELGKSELLGKTYTISATVNKSANNVPLVNIYYGNENNMTINSSNFCFTQTGKIIANFPSAFPTNCDRVFLLLYSNQNGIGNVGDYVDYTNLQVYEGTEEKPYRPYGYNAFIENKGKNLINPNQTIYTNAGVTIKNNGDGSYTASGTSTRALSIKLTDDLFTLKSGLPYTNSIEILDGNMPNGVQIAVKVSNANGTITYNYINLNSNLLSNTVTPNEDKILEGYELYCNAAGISINFTFRVQLEQNNKATEWQPYFYNSYTIPLNAPLRSLPKGTKDILNNKGITRRVGKIVLNGSENWEGFISSYKNTIRAQVLISDMHNIGNNVGLNIMSSHFLPKNLYGHDIVGIEHTYNQLFIRINKYDLDEISLNGFKAWLAAHPTEVIYELATAQNESYEGQTPSPDTPSPIISVGDVKNLIDVPDFNVDYNQQYYQNTNTKFLLKPNYTYTLSFDFNINKSSTDLYYSLGYGTDRYATDITKTTIYSTQTKGRNEITFTVPADIPDNSYLWVRFAKTIILADINVDISNIQLEKGKEDTGYQPTTDYNIYPTVSSKNLFDYDNPLYIRTNNLNYNEISNGYHMSPISVGENTEFTIGIENCFNEGDIYALSFSQLGEFGYVAMYKTLKGTQERVNIIDLNNNIFTAPSQNYDLELVFSMSSSALSNSLEIWSIQIEANNTQTTYETHEENSSIITLDTPLNRIGDYADWVGNISPNLLNPVTGSAIVEENTDYFYNKKSTYTASVTIQYKNADGNVISSETLANDSTISTPENCVEIHIEGLNEQAIKTNHLQIRKGNSNKPYLPYITEPSLIKVTDKVILDGSNDENWILSGNPVNNQYIIEVSDFPEGYYLEGKILCDYFSPVDSSLSYSSNEVIGIGGWDNSHQIRIGFDINIANRNLSEFKNWLSNHPTEVIYLLEEPEITPLSSLNSEALKTLETYEPISNIYTNNKLLGTLDLDYANGKDMKEVQNAYVLLKCWNGNKMPYVIHSNYIDIPESTENIFIWMRRKKNIFDLRIENLTKGD